MRVHHALEPQGDLSLDTLERSGTVTQILSRRRFAAATVAASAAAFGLPASSSSREPSISEAGHRPEGLSPEEWEEVQERYHNLLRVYGHRLSAQQRHTLVNILSTNAQMLRSIRSFVIQNAAPSALTLRLVTQDSRS